MRLDKSRSSRNVEDRRANGPRLSGGKIGLGTIVLALVAMYFGVDPSVVLNLAEMPTGDLVLNRDADLRVPARVDAIRAAVGRDNVQGFDANQIALRLLGDSVFANVMMLG